jgi:hypothetical protein
MATSREFGGAKGIYRQESALSVLEPGFRLGRSATVAVSEWPGKSPGDG